jgi:hypothetical protein
MKKFEKYIDSLRINKVGDKYEVFTIPTQHFTVGSIEDLTIEMFDLQTENHLAFLKIEREIFALSFPDISENIGKYLLEHYKNETISNS